MPVSKPVGGHGYSWALTRDTPTQPADVDAPLLTSADHKHSFHVCVGIHVGCQDKPQMAAVGKPPRAELCVSASDPVILTADGSH